nr:MAG TPA: hypothetical protein [Caudoviricetes sp.]
MRRFPFVPTLSIGTYPLVIIFLSIGSDTKVRFFTSNF